MSTGGLQMLHFILPKMPYAVFNQIAAIKTLSLGNGYISFLQQYLSLGEILVLMKVIFSLYAFVNQKLTGGFNRRNFFKNCF